MARIASGFVISWSALDESGQSRVFVMSLDNDAHSVRVTKLPPAESAGPAEDFHPAIASDNHQAVVVWVEESSSQRWAIVAARLDQMLNVTATRTIVGNAPSVDPPKTVWNGSDYFVAA